MVNSGTLRHRASFFSVSRDTNETGQQKKVPATSVVQGIPVSIQSVGGDERRRGQQMVAGATHVVRLRFLTKIELLPDMYLEVPRDPPGNGAIRRFQILRVVDPTGMRRELLIHCVEQPLANTATPPLG